MKGILGIGGALTFGILIILGALSVKDSVQAEDAGQAIVAKAPERKAITILDSDGDGVQDWEESLQAQVFNTIATPTSTSAIDESVPYTPPDTFTGKFSEAFFKDYMEGKIRGQDFTDPSAFVETAVKAIDKNTQSKRHSRLELTIVPSTDESIRDYGNRVAEIMQIHSINNEPETEILNKALNENDPDMLKDLEPIANVYQNIIADTLVMEVPDTFANAHIDLLDANEAILLDIEAMQLSFTDPLYSLARVKNYRGDAGALYVSLSTIATALSENKVTYAKDEPGAFFYLFDI